MSVGIYEIMPRDEVQANFDNHSAQLASMPKLTDLTNFKKITGKSNSTQLLAFDNFDDVSKWYFTLRDGTNSPSPWTASGNKINSPILTGNFESNAIYQNVKMADGKIQVLYENPDSAGTAWCGVVFRHDKVNNKRLAVLLFDGNPGTCSIWQINGTTLTAIGTGVQLLDPDVQLQTGKAISLEVQIMGFEIKVWINNRIMLTSRDPAIQGFLTGECGLIGDKSKSYQFSNFQISQKRFDVMNSNITKVLTIGSSITNGYNVSRSWRDRFGDNIQNQLTGQPVTVVNGGVNGSNTTDMLSRLPALIAANLDANICTIETSVNDCKISAPIPFTTTIANLRTMIKLCKQDNITPILMTATPINVTYTSSDWSMDSFRQIAQLNNRVRELAFEENIRLIDNAIAFGNNSYSNKLALLQSADYIHPNDTGAQLMADTAINTILA